MERTMGGKFFQWYDKNKANINFDSLYEIETKLIKHYFGAEKVLKKEFIGKKVTFNPQGDLSHYEKYFGVIAAVYLDTRGSLREPFDSVVFQVDILKKNRAALINDAFIPKSNFLTPSSPFTCKISDLDFL